MRGNYVFIDGSALLAQIRALRKHDGSFSGKQLCLRLFTKHIIDSLYELHEGQYKRITLYFPTGDEQILSDYLSVPNHNKPGEVRDLHIKYCGFRIKKSADTDKWVEENVPEKHLSRFNKSEKQIDIEICCDALKLAAASLVDRLFLLTNDDDFVPLCRSLKEYGANVSILHLTDVKRPNASLLREADSYDIVPMEKLPEIFITPPADEQEVVGQKADGVEEEVPEKAEEPVYDDAGADSEGGDENPSDLDDDQSPKAKE